MAELTKDQIKEALGFIADAKKILDIFNNAESAIAVLGQLDASVSSLGTKSEKLREEVKELEGQKAKFSAEREAQKKTLDSQRASTMEGIEEEGRKRVAKLMDEFGMRSSGMSADLAREAEKKSLLISDIADLNKKRDGLLLDIEAQESNQAAEQSRLDAILAKIAELKSRL